MDIKHQYMFPTKLTKTTVTDESFCQKARTSPRVCDRFVNFDKETLACLIQPRRNQPLPIDALTVNVMAVSFTSHSTLYVPFTMAKFPFWTNDAVVLSARTLTSDSTKFRANMFIRCASQLLCVVVDNQPRRKVFSRKRAQKSRLPLKTKPTRIHEKQNDFVANTSKSQPSEVAAIQQAST